MKSSVRLIWAILMLWALNGCGGSSSPQDIGVQDVSDLTSQDLSLDAPMETAADLAVDSSLDQATDQGQDADPQDLEEELPWIPTEMEAHIDTQPFGIDFIQNGKVLTRLRAPQGALSLVGEDYSEILLSGAPQVQEKGQATTLTYELQDGREATILVQPVENGGWEVLFEVEGKTKAERLDANFQVTATEGFYGLMERTVQGPQDKSWKEGITEGLNLRGQKLELMVIFTLSLYSPFFLSSRGWGLFVDSNWPGTYDLASANDDQVHVSYEGPNLRMVVYPGPEPADVAAKYARTVGTTILPPRWVFGPWRWRDDIWPLEQYYDGTPATGPYNSMVVEDILMMEAFGIPCSLYWIDRPWGPGSFGYGDMEWDPVRLPNPQEMVQWINGKGIQFMLWIAPWAVGDQMAPECAELGYRIENPIPVGTDGGHLIDLTNPDAVDWWQGYLQKPMQDNVVGFKLDRGEEMVPDGLMFSGTTFDGTDYRELRNLYPALYAKAVHDAFVEFGMDEFVVMPRSGWKTTSHHAVVWGGDTAPTQWGLRSAIIALQRSAVMNFPVWGSDTCGYGGMAPKETCLRWLGFSGLSPLMEVGPTDNVAFWSWRADNQDGSVGPEGYNYEPVYDEELIATWIFYSNLHNDLADYLYQQAQMAHESGQPVVRPLFFADPENPAYLDQFDQYFLGPDLLVAPVWQEGVTQRQVLIPPGTWTDAWTGESIEGPTEVSVETPVHKVPLYIKGDSSLDLGDLPQRFEQASLKAASRPDLSALEAAQGFGSVQ